jgi:hypothetical protein
MSLLVNTAEGGTDATGVTVGNSGGASGDAFGQVNTSGGTIQYTSTAIHGGLSIVLTQPTLASVCNIDFDDAAASASFAFSAYFTTPVLPSVTDQLFPLTMRSLSGALGNVQMSTTGQIKVNIGTVTSAYSTPVISTGTVYRIEGQGTGWGTAATACDIQIYVGHNTGTPFISVSASGGTTALPVQRLRWGKGSGTSTISGFTLDSIQQNIGSSTAIGPFIINASPTPTVAPATGAANDATVSTPASATNAPADVASATGSAPFDPSGAGLSLSLSLDQPASATGMATDATPVLGPQAAVAAATGTANNASTLNQDVTFAAAQTATGTGVANDAAVSASPGAYPTVADATGAALDASVVSSFSIVNGLPDTATASGVAFDAAISLVVPPPWLFTTPTIQERSLFSRNGLFARLHLDLGLSILKFGSSYQQITTPSTEQIESADAVYIGGRIYKITSSEAALLTLAGYGAYVSEVVSI